MLNGGPWKISRFLGNQNCFSRVQALGKNSLVLYQLIKKCSLNSLNLNVQTFF